MKTNTRFDNVRRRVLSAVLMMASVVVVHAEPFTIDITGTSLEELANISVTSVSKSVQSLQGAPSAIYVLTGEELLRSGATSIPDALRRVPGVNVARVDASKYAVSIRGFNSRTANKLLVLVDGRSIYDPLFSGVVWESKDVMFEDVHRIEVIRGPGGTLWGANAVNGVINIITRSAAETQGGLVTVGAGTEEEAFVRSRYGWQLSENTHARIYGMGFERDRTRSVDGAVDDWNRIQGGFRLDWDDQDMDHVTFQGDLYDGEAGEAVAPGIGPRISQDVGHSGGNLLMRWTRTLGDGEHFSLQTFYDRTELDNVILGEERDTADVEFQHRFPWLDGHDVIWGTGYRHTTDEIRNTAILSLLPEKRGDAIWSAFIRDEIQLIPEQLKFAAGAKFEHNDYTGNEVQPSVRLSWMPAQTHTLWTSVSRAIRTPTRLESDLFLEFDGITFAGNKNLKAEELTAYEAGYRTLLNKVLLLDLAVFYNDFNRLASAEGTQFGNEVEGRTTGAEAVATWQVNDRVRVEATYSLLDMALTKKPGSLQDPVSLNAQEKNDPQHQAYLGVEMDVCEGVSLSGDLRYVDRISSQNVSDYLVGDIRLAWTPIPDLELSVVGRDLFESSHAEQGGTSINEIQESVYAQVTWTF